MADYNKAVELNPKLAKAYAGRGIIKADSLKDISGALADFNSALNLDPQYALAYYNRGLLKAGRLNDVSSSVSDLRKAAQLSRKQEKTQLLKQTIELLKELGATED